MKNRSRRARRSEPLPAMPASIGLAPAGRAGVQLAEVERQMYGRAGFDPLRKRVLL